MGYKDDPDLNFLGECSSEQLDPLVSYLIFKKGRGPELRDTEELSGRPGYKGHAPDHARYWDEIAWELQLFGGNTLANLARGDEGVPYREILIEVCEKMKVNFNPQATTSLIESNLLLKILTDSLDQMDENARRELVDQLKLNTTTFTGPAVAAALQAAVRLSGFAAYQIAVIVANAVARQLLGHGLKVGANAGLARAIGVAAGPVGWVITGLWTLVSIAGPAYRVTIPCVIQVAFLRALHRHGRVDAA